MGGGYGRKCELGWLVGEGDGRRNEPLNANLGQME